MYEIYIYIYIYINYIEIRIYYNIAVNSWLIHKMFSYSEKNISF